MNLAEINALLDKNKNTNGIIGKKIFKTLFEILPAGDDGNCLFYSVEQLDSTYNYKDLRKEVCDYYKHFDTEGSYPQDSIKERLQIQMISDNIDDDGRLHQNKICRDRVWSGIMDVIALTDILRINIVLIIMRKEGYTAQPYMYKENAKTIFVKYNGINHFEPLLPKFAVNSPSKSLSPRTKRMIAEMDKLSPKKSSPKKSSPQHTLKACPSDKELNPTTGRCVKKCSPGFSRDENFKCKTKKNKTKSKSLKAPSLEVVMPDLKTCPSDKELNPTTGRCVKKCSPGFSRDENFKCKTKKNKTKKNKTKIVSLKNDTSVMPGEPGSIWQQKESKTHKKMYWVNTKTNETMWKLPKGLEKK